MQEILVLVLGWEVPLEKGQASHSSILGLPWWLRWQRICLQCGRPRLIPELGRSPGRGRGNPLQYSCLENPHGQRSLSGYSPWGCKELDTTERLSTALSRFVVVSHFNLQVANSMMSIFSYLICQLYSFLVECLFRYFAPLMGLLIFLLLSFKSSLFGQKSFIKSVLGRYF